MALDTPTILLFLAMIWAVAIWIHALRLRPLLGAGWLALSALILAVSGAGLYAFPHYVGYASGALFIIWDEAEDTDQFSDGPIPVFLLSPFAKGGGKKPYSNTIHYDHSSTLKTIQEIFGVKPLLRAAGHKKTVDLSDLFQ